MPSLVAHKQRKLELRAGYPTQHGNRKGKAASYSLKDVRAAERDGAARAEEIYRRMVGSWQPTRPHGKTSTPKKAMAVGADASNGTRLESRRAKHAASTSSPSRLLFARRPPPPPPATRYCGPRRGQGRSSRRGLHLDRGCGPPVSGSGGGPADNRRS